MAARSARLPSAEPAPRKEQRGVVERLTYQNPENGDTVARLAPRLRGALGGEAAPPGAAEEAG